MTTGRKIYISISWILVIVCMGIIFALSAQVAEESKELSDSLVRRILELLGIEFAGEYLRTIAHMLEFTGLSLLLFNAIYATWQHKLTLIFAFVSTVLYAISDEIHQIFVDGRAFQLSDILVDSIGGLIGAVASYIILKIILTTKKRGNINGNIKTF